MATVLQSQQSAPPHSSTAAVVLAIVATFRVLDPLERQVVAARWHLAEAPEQTCERLCIQPAAYEQAMKKAVRLIRNPGSLGLQSASAASN